MEAKLKMKRNRLSMGLVLLALLLPVVQLRADVKTERKSQVKFEGFLGKMMGMFGGSAAKEGAISTVAVKGNRKAEMSENAGQIIDLSEQKVYSLDLRKKTYQVETFAEIRRKMMEAQEKAAKAAKDAKEETDQRPQGQEMEIDFSLKESGQSKNINGYDCREVIMTITTRPKGKTLEQGGGMVMTSNMWLGPEIPALKEITDFDLRYWKMLDLQGSFGDMEQMAAAMAMYPGMKEMMAKFQAQQVNMKGTPIMTVTVMESAKSAEQAAAAQKSQEEQGGGTTSIRGLGGLGGMIGKKLAPKKEDSGYKVRTTIMTVNDELLKAVNSASDADIAIPAGFKEKK
jgi:hypothetical protein